MLFTNDRFKNLSAEAKTLYGIMLDRLSLSVKNGWTDSRGRVYIIYTIEQIMADMNCADQKATKLLDELEKKYGLIERKRQGLCKPNLIFVKNFITGMDNPMKTRIRSSENHDSGAVNTTTQDYRKSQGINTDNSNTDNNDTNPILSGLDDEGMRERRQYEDYFRKTLMLDVLLKSEPDEEETILGILNILVDTCCTKRKEIRIAGDDKPAEVVKSQLMKLTPDHIRYVLKCLTENSTQVRNIRQYLLAALYNAPITMSSYYQAKVNYDFYGGSRKQGRRPALEDYSCDPDESL